MYKHNILILCLFITFSSYIKADVYDDMTDYIFEKVNCIIEKGELDMKALLDIAKLTMQFNNKDLMDLISIIQKNKDKIEKCFTESNIDEFTNKIQEFINDAKNSMKESWNNYLNCLNNINKDSKHESLEELIELIKKEKYSEALEKESEIISKNNQLIKKCLEAKTNTN